MGCSLLSGSFSGNPDWRRDTASLGVLRYRAQCRSRVARCLWSVCLSVVCLSISAGRRQCSWLIRWSFSNTTAEVRESDSGDSRGNVLKLDKFLQAGGVRAYSATVLEGVDTCRVPRDHDVPRHIQTVTQPCARNCPVRRKSKEAIVIRIVQQNKRITF